MSEHVKRGVKRGRDAGTNTWLETAPPGDATLGKFQSIIPPATTSSAVVSLADTPPEPILPATTPTAAIPASAMHPAVATSKLSAQDAILNTIELLEKILLALPMRDLLINQRVSQHWKNVIDGSIEIQRALFFLSEAEPTLYVYSRTRDTFRTATEADLASDLDDTSSPSTSPSREAIIQAVNINSLLINVPSGTSLLTSFNSEEYSPDPKQILELGNVHTKQTQHGKPLTDSWRRMYIVQPSSLHTKSNLVFASWYFYSALLEATLQDLKPLSKLHHIDPPTMGNLIDKTQQLTKLGMWIHLRSSMRVLAPYTVCMTELEMDRVERANGAEVSVAEIITGEKLELKEECDSDDDQDQSDEDQDQDDGEDENEDDDDNEGHDDDGHEDEGDGHENVGRTLVVKDSETDGPA